VTSGARTRQRGQASGEAALSSISRSTTSQPPSIGEDFLFLLNGARVRERRARPTGALSSDRLSRALWRSAASADDSSSIDFRVTSAAMPPLSVEVIEPWWRITLDLAVAIGTVLAAVTARWAARTSNKIAADDRRHVTSLPAADRTKRRERDNPKRTYDNLRSDSTG
jgi:hypothetical protein